MVAWWWWGGVGGYHVWCGTVRISGLYQRYRHISEDGSTNVEPLGCHCRQRDPWIVWLVLFGAHGELIKAWRGGHLDIRCMILGHPPSPPPPPLTRGPSAFPPKSLARMLAPVCSTWFARVQRRAKLICGAVSRLDSFDARVVDHPCCCARGIRVRARWSADAMVGEGMVREQVVF